MKNNTKYAKYIAQFFLKLHKQLILQFFVLMCFNIIFHHSICLKSLAQTTDVSAFKKETGAVDDNFSWTAIGGYKINNNLFQVEIRGRLERGFFVFSKTKLFQKIIKKDKAQKSTIDAGLDVSLKEISSEFLFEKFEFEIIKDEGPDFILQMQLPKGIYQMKLQAKVDGQFQNYEFEIETHDKWPMAPPPAAPLFLCSHCVFMSGGIDYLSYKNPMNASLLEMNYSSLSWPALNLHYRKKLNLKSGLRAEILTNRGKSINSPEYNVIQNSSVSYIQWSLGGDYISKYKGYLLGSNYSSGYLYFIQQASMPYSYLNKSKNEFSVKYLNSMSLSGGGFFAIKFWNSEFVAKLNLVLPISYQGLGFEGALTYLQSGDFQKSKKEPFYWGLSWGGQYHAFSNFKVPDSNRNANYSLFLSKIEVLLGWQFN